MKTLKKKTENVKQNNEKKTENTTLNTTEIITEKIATESSSELTHIRMSTIQQELLTECSNILMQDKLEPDNLAIESMQQLSYALKSLTNQRKERVVNGEPTLREELPFSMASDCKKLAEGIGIMMKHLNESRKIRTSTYIKLKELAKEDK